MIAWRPVGVPEFESGTSSLSATRSNQLSYTPVCLFDILQYSPKYIKQRKTLGCEVLRADETRETRSINETQSLRELPWLSNGGMQLLPLSDAFFRHPTPKFLNRRFLSDQGSSKITLTADKNEHDVYSRQEYPTLQSTHQSDLYGMTDRIFTSPDLPSRANGLTKLASPLKSCVAAGLACVLLASTAAAKSPTPAEALGLAPVQKDVSFEQVKAADVAKCEIRDVEHESWTGWEVVAGDGTLLRRFADTNGDNKVDLWCYFNFGIEVYRDIDADFNGKADQYQWMGTAGTRWGLDENEDQNIDSWRRISVEEVSSELVAALRDSDANRFARLLASERELIAIGLGKAKSKSLAEKANRAARSFAALAKRQTVVRKGTKWVQFAAARPGIVPAGTQGSKQDVVVYENAVAMFEEAGKGGQLVVGTVIKVNDGWRLVDLPSVGEDGDAVAQTPGNFFTPASAALASSAGGAGDATQELVINLERIDKALATESSANAIARLHDERADAVEALIKAAPTASERETWTRQLVDTVSVAIQSGAYPNGLARLKSVSRKFASKNKALSAYADFQAIGTEYVQRQSKNTKFEEVQEWYLKTLNTFIDRYPKTLEAAQGTLQLALSKEFEDKERDAIRYYRQVANGFPNTDAGEKAAGAIRRLDSVGRRIEFGGSTIDGRKFSLSNLRGHPVVIHYWATWCEPCKQDTKVLRRLQVRYKGLELVGVNVDNTRKLAQDYLAEASMPWVQLFEEGGLESSPLSNAFGVQTLPTMMLIDSSGKVVRHNVHASELDDELMKMTKPGKK